MAIKFRLLTLLLAATISGCSGQKVDESTDTINRLNEIVDDLKVRITQLEFKEYESNPTYLRIDDKSYSVLHTELCNLAVTIENIKEYANGSSIDFMIGNPCSLLVSGINFEIEYGNTEGGNVWEKKKIKDPITLKPGHWNRLNVILDKVPPKKMTIIKISSPSFESISLR